MVRQDTRSDDVQAAKEPLPKALKRKGANQAYVLDVNEGNIGQMNVNKKGCFGKPSASGKREEGPAPGPATMLWGAPELRPTAGKSVQGLFRATPGSTGLDLSSSAYAGLTPEMGMQALPTGVFGSLPVGTLGLILGRSSTTMKGVLVAPGVIDEASTGEIKVMTQSPMGISVIQHGQRIAQLLLIPYAKSGKTANSRVRGNAGFGSLDAHCI